MASLVDELRDAIADGSVVVVAGAGVAAAASGGAAVATWPGLLRAGVDWVEAHPPARLPAGWAEQTRRQIDSGDIEWMISAAEEVTVRLGGAGGGEFHAWLAATVGGLPVVDRAVVEALCGLGTPVATTNYDGVMEAVSGRVAVTWQDGAKVARTLRGGDPPAVAHLHGYWDEPASVVLGVRSYERVLVDGAAQALQQAMAAMRSLLLVGFGAGLSDPNFGALRKWLAATFPGTQYRHFRLCLDAEVDAVRAEHEPGERISVVPYGPTHDALARFLRSLAPPTSVTAGTGRPALSAGSSVGLPPPRTCVGRDDTIAALTASWLGEPPVPVPVLGPPGIGKTTVCVAGLYDPSVVARFGDRRWFVRCDGAESASLVAAGIAAEIGVPVDGAGPLIGRVCGALGAGPGLLVLDNLETPWWKHPVEVEELLGHLAAVDGLRLAVTVRGANRPAQVRWRDGLYITPLAAADATRMFLAIAGTLFASDPLLPDLLAGLDGVPLAVELLGYIAQGEPDLVGLTARWQAEHTRMLTRAGPERRELSVPVSIELSIASPLTTPPARRLLTLLGVLPDGIARRDLPTLLGPDGYQAASTLVQVGLAFYDGDRLRTLAPIRDHISAGHPPTDADLTTVVDHYSGLAARLGNQVGR